MSVLVPDRVKARFWSRVAVGSPDTCWLWQMSVGSHGYGQIGWQDDVNHYMVLAHRLAYELAVGPIPDGMTIDHKCRTRPCCNPGHLRLMTNVANATLNGQEFRLIARKATNTTWLTPMWIQKGHVGVGNATRIEETNPGRLLCVGDCP